MDGMVCWCHGGGGANIKTSTEATNDQHRSSQGEGWPCYSILLFISIIKVAFSFTIIGNIISPGSLEN